MDLRVSVVLLFTFLTGGYSLKCYSCDPDATGFCAAKVETCPDGFSTCQTHIAAHPSRSSHLSVTTKGCTKECDPMAKQLPFEKTLNVRCCNTDLCNAADGVYKGSFLLLLSPLLFYFLFQSS